MTNTPISTTPFASVVNTNPETSSQDDTSFAAALTDANSVSAAALVSDVVLASTATVIGTPTAGGQLLRGPNRGITISPPPTGFNPPTVSPPPNPVRSNRPLGFGMAALVATIGGLISLSGTQFRWLRLTG